MTSSILIWISFYYLDTNVSDSRPEQHELFFSRLDLLSRQDSGSRTKWGFDCTGDDEIMESPPEEDEQRVTTRVNPIEVNISVISCRVIRGNLKHETVSG